MAAQGTTLAAEQEGGECMTEADVSAVRVNLWGEEEEEEQKVRRNTVASHVEFILVPRRCC